MLGTNLCTRKAELQIEREDAVNRLCAAFEANGIPVPHEDRALFFRSPLHTVIENAVHWESKAREAEEAIDRALASVAPRGRAATADRGRSVEHSLKIYHGDYYQE